MPAPTPAAVNSSHYDANQQPSLVLVSGTLGTSDTGGTALTMPAAGNPVTGALYVEQIGAASSGGTNVNIISGTQQVAGTIMGGTIENINGGTITISNPVTAVTVGTMPQVSIGTLPSVTVTNPGTFTNIVTGTQQILGTVGTVTGIGTVSNLGSVTTLGTIKELTNLAGGTFNTGTVDTELLPPATIGSNTANPTITQIQVFPMLWNDASALWQRLPGDINGGLVTRQFQSSAADSDTISNTAAAPQSSTGNPLYERMTMHALNAGTTWSRVREANFVNNTVGTGLLGAGILGQDSGGTYHALAVSTGGSIGTLFISDAHQNAFGTFLGTTGAVTGTTIMGTTTGLGSYFSMTVSARLQGAGGTAKTDIYLQTSPDGGATWIDYAHFPQLAASATAINAFTVSRGAQSQAGIYTVGTGTVPALGVGTCIGGDFTDRIRYVAAVATGGTNAGTCTFNLALTS